MMDVIGSLGEGKRAPGLLSFVFQADREPGSSGLISSPVVVARRKGKWLGSNSRERRTGSEVIEPRGSGSVPAVTYLQASRLVTLKLPDLPLATMKIDHLFVLPPRPQFRP